MDFEDELRRLRQPNDPTDAGELAEALSEADRIRLVRALGGVWVPPEGSDPTGLLHWMRRQQTDTEETLAMLQMLAESLAVVVGEHNGESEDETLRAMRLRFQHILYDNVGVDVGVTDSYGSKWWRADPGDDATEHSATPDPDDGSTY